MQINISDQDVKLHTRILQRLQLLLIVAMGLTIATLYNAGAFSKTPVADAKPVATKAESVVSNSTPTDKSASTAAAEDVVVDESDSNVAAESDTQPTNQPDDTPSDEPTDSSIELESDTHEATNPAQTVPVAQLPIPKHEAFDSEADLPLSNPTPDDNSGDRSVFDPLVVTELVNDRAKTLLGDYVRLRKRLHVSGKQIAMTAKRLAASHAGGGSDAATVSADAVTLETAKSNSISREPIEDSQDSIVIRNAKVNRGTVAFLVGREVKQLKPGASLKLPADQTTVVVRFHRGGEFGNATLTLSPGIYEFEATARGWYLETAKD